MKIKENTATKSPKLVELFPSKGGVDIMAVRQRIRGVELLKA